MPGYRRMKVNEEVAHAISDILRTIKDPRVSGVFMSITRVDVTGDLKSAMVYYSFLGEDTPELRKDVKKGLYSAAGYIRHELATRLNLRETPELDFRYDESLVRGAEIEKLLHEIAETAKPEEPDEN